MADYRISQLTEDPAAADTDLIEVSKNNGDGTYSSRKQQRSTLIDGLATETALASHEANTANPHAVTAVQVGAPTAAEFAAHAADVSNPHSVTKTQVGLSNADNTSDAAKPVSAATQSALDAKANTTSLNTHIADVANPHAVTKAQVGLSAVDNTSDAAKPISTATQTALNAKADAADVPATIVKSVVAGTNVTVDNTNPANPVVSASGGGGGTNETNLTTTQAPTTVTINSDTGTDATITAADGTNAGVMTGAMQTKLAGIATGATANDSDANLKNRANHTGAQLLSTISDVNATATELNYVDGVTSAIQTQIDSKAATAHSHAIADVTDLQTTLDGKADDAHTHTAADVTDFAETVRDTMGTALVAGTNVTITPDDAGDTITIAAAGGGGSVATDTIFDAKGDLAVGTAADTASRLALGTDGHVLTADSTTATGVKWAAASGGGGSSAMTGLITTYDSFDSFVQTASGGVAGAAFGYGYISTASSTAGNNIKVYKNATGMISTGLPPRPWTFSHVVTLGGSSTSGDRTYYHRFISSSTDATLGTANQIGFYVPFTAGVAGDTVFSSGNGTTQQTTSVALTWEVWTEYANRVSVIYAADGSVEFYFNGVLQATHSTNVPTISTSVRLQYWALSYLINGSTAVTNYGRLIQSAWHWEA